MKMDFQPKSVSVAAGGLSLAVCVEQVISFVSFFFFYFGNFSKVPQKNSHHHS